MITKLHLVNWKSFEDSTIYIDPLTFLIGTNASGKSNVLGKMRLLPFVVERIGLSERGRLGLNWE